MRESGLLWSTLLSFDLKLPTRPAPEPPKLRPARVASHHIPSKTTTNCTNGASFKLSRSQSAGKLAGNKQPPPRPPPPPLKLLKNSKSLTSYFPFNKKQTVPKNVPQSQPGSKLVKSETFSSLSGTESSVAGELLIDLNSPPSSPTLTARTSSDNYSLNSYSSVTNSQIESGFEDDFDSLIISSSTSASQGDPWGDTLTSDRKKIIENVPAFELSNEDPKSRYKPVNYTLTTSTIRPTIIRPKNSKPARPPPPKLRPASTPPTLTSQPVDWSSPPGDWSPPMPSCPPPPPPPEAISGPSLPPRPSKLIQTNDGKKKPYCIAVYDYETGHQDDLSFKVNDVISLTEKINSDWLKGRLNDKEGMFPSNFVNVVVPLETLEENKPKCAVALYNFVPQTWDDLSFQEGDTVQVIRRLNENWLYGECNGKQGQFPENYVTDISSLYPYLTQS